MTFAVQTSYSQVYQYGEYSSRSNRTDADFNKELMGKATSLSNSSSNGKNIGIMTIGNKGYIAEYADSSTEKDPVIKVGDYEVRVNDVDPKNATEIEMFALTSYMDDKGLTDNTGMKTFNKLRAYSTQAEYNGFCNGISDSKVAWRVNRDWTAILYNAKETYFAMSSTYEHGLKCQSIIDALESWSDSRLLKRAEPSNTFDASNFKEVETANYKFVPEPEIGGLRILVNGESAGVFMSENLKVQEDAQTGTKVLISEMPGLNSSWYDAIPVTEELEKALAEAVGVDKIPHKELTGYYIGTHAGTGIRYVMRPGDEGKGGKVLLCNATDEARYKALCEEYVRKYPNLVTSPQAGEFYASLEIRGMAQRGAGGIITTHPDNISYSDDSDSKKNWSAKIDDKTWNLLLGWLRNHRLDSEETSKFSYWDKLFGTIGGKYERVWSDDEIRQGYLYQ